MSAERAAVRIGSSAPNADGVHRVRVGDRDYSAQYLAGPHAPIALRDAATAVVLECLQCGRPASAVDLYRDSPIPGECRDCAADLL